MEFLIDFRHHPKADGSVARLKMEGKVVVSAERDVPVGLAHFQNLSTCSKYKKRAENATGPQTGHNLESRHNIFPSRANHVS